MTTLFISDLHLESERPDIGAQFLDFLDNEARSAEALYILGDLFETWVGDDDPDPHYAGIKTALRELTDAGVPVYFMHGNRDFLVGADFAAETGARILADPHLADLYGQSVLLSHGDAMCTDDTQYQQVRKMTRAPEWQAMILAKTLPERQAIAAAARAESQQRSSKLVDAIRDGDRPAIDIMDVNQDAVASTMRDAGVSILLHGHTHRPAVHEFELDGQAATRIVLGDWYEQGSVVRWDESGFSLERLSRD
jgi:UDP-2,3-diacylglucosamine hydrolase